MKTRFSAVLDCLATSILLALAACGGGTPTPAADAITFIADRTSLQAGECTILRWDVTGGFGVTLDTRPVERTGQMEVCPTESRGYELSVDMGTHVETRRLEINVSATGQESEGSTTNTTVVPAYQAGSWVYTGGPLGGLGYDVRMDPRDPDVMYVTDAWAGAFKSTDGGESWFAINNGIPPYFGPSSDAIPVFSLTVDPNNPDTLWAGTQYTSRVYRSDNAGESWQQLNTGSNGIIEEFLSIRGFTVEPGNSDVVYFAAEVSSWEWNVSSLAGLGMDMTKGVIYKTDDGGQTWQRIWYGDNLARYVWIHPLDHNLIYASTGIFDREAANSDPAAIEPGGLGVLRSRDGGATWETLGAANGFDAYELYIGSLFMHPQDPDILLAAAGNDPYGTHVGHPLGGIYRTDDGGDTWTETLDGHNFSSVEICSSDPDVAYASARTGFFRSEDSGQTWQQVTGRNWGPPDAVVGWPIDMQCDPENTQRIFVNAYGGGVFLSKDGGQTWAMSSKGYTGALMSNVTVAADDAARVFVSARSGIFTSTDGGENWQGLNSGVARDLEGTTIAVDPDDPDHLLAVFRDTGLRPKVTYDGGQTWEETTIETAIDSETGNGGITRIVFAPTDGSIVFATVGDFNCLGAASQDICNQTGGLGVFVSRDGGSSWEATPLASGQVTDLAVAGDNRRVYAGLHDGTLYRSEDAGETWQIVSENLTTIPPTSNDPDAPASVIIALTVDPSSPETVYAGFFHGGIAVSQDGGLTWTASSSGMIPESSVYSIVVDPTNPDEVYAGANDSGVYLSLDGGQTWAALNSGLLTRAVRDLAISPDGSILYMASEGGGVSRLGTPGR